MSIIYQKIIFGDRVPLRGVGLLECNNIRKGEQHIIDGSKGRVQKKTDYLVTLIKRVGRYLAEITIS